MISKQEVIAKLTQPLDEEPIEAYHKSFGRLHVYNGNLYYNDTTGTPLEVPITRGNFLLGTNDELYKKINNLP